MRDAASLSGMWSAGLLSLEACVVDTKYMDAFAWVASLTSTTSGLPAGGSVSTSERDPYLTRVNRYCSVLQTMSGGLVSRALTCVVGVPHESSDMDTYRLGKQFTIDNADRRFFFD